MVKKKIWSTMIAACGAAILVSGCGSSNTAEAPAAEETASVSVSEESAETESEAAAESEETEPEEAAPEFTEAEIGGVIETTPLTMTLDQVEVKDEYQFSVTTEKTSGIKVTKNNSIEPGSGLQLVCLKGELTNLTSSDLYVTSNIFNAEFVINDNTYNTRLKCIDLSTAESVSTVVPQQTTDYFLYAEVPDAVAGSIDSCVLRIGIDDELSQKETQLTELQDMDFIYTVDCSDALNSTGDADEEAAAEAEEAEAAEETKAAEKSEKKKKKKEAAAEADENAEFKLNIVLNNDKKSTEPSNVVRTDTIYIHICAENIKNAPHPDPDTGWFGFWYQVTSPDGSIYKEYGWGDGMYLDEGEWNAGYYYFTNPEYAPVGTLTVDVYDLEDTYLGSATTEIVG